MRRASLLDAHSHAEIADWVEAKVDQANNLHKASNVNVSYELVDVRSVLARVPSLEPGGSRLETIHKAWLPDADHSISVLRDGYGADMAVLVTEPFVDVYGLHGHDICGIAALPAWSNGTLVLSEFDDLPFTDQAFALIEYGCGESKARDDLTFAHELGHTFGLRHAKPTPHSQSLFPFSYGYVDDQPHGFATLMGCVRDPDDDTPAINGVCNRIPRLSDPDGVHLPDCKALFCQQPTGCDQCGGVEATDNRLALCSRAEGYAAFRELSDDRPPRVLADPSPIVATSGDLVELEAQASDDEDGDLSGSIQWIDESGELLGVGPTLDYRVYNPGRSFVGARVTDSAGAQDTAWLPFETNWEPDAYEPGDEHPLNLLAPDSYLVRTFDAADDLDKARVSLVSLDGQDVHIKVAGIGPRAAPQMQVRGIGAFSGVIHSFEDGPEFVGPPVQPGATAYSIEVRAADGSSGLGTDYIVRADTFAPATVAPEVGGWSNPARSGNGVDFRRVAGDDYVAIWYTYRPDTSPIWYASDVGTMDGQVWRSVVIETHRDAEGTIIKEHVGDIALDFASPGAATLSWSINGQGSGQEPIQHDLGQSDQANGMWYAPADSGWGLSMWQQPGALVLTANLYDANGDPTWVQAVADGAAQSGLGWTFSNVYQVVSGVNLCPGCVGEPSVTFEGDLGSAAFDLDGPGAATGELSLTVDFGAGISGGWFVASTPVARLAPG